MLLRLKWPHYAAWALQLRLLRTHAVRTTILRRPSAFRCIYGSIPWQARMFWTHFFLNVDARFYILKTSFDFIQVWIISFQIICNVNHKLINWQHWKLHMIALFRSSWYKYHKSLQFYPVNFCHWCLHFSKGFYRFTPHVVVWMRSFVNRIINCWCQDSIADILPNFTHILLRCFARLRRRDCDVTAFFACPQRPYGASVAMLGRPVSAATSLRLFWSCSKLAGDLGDLTAICCAATALYDISHRPTGDQRRPGRFCRSQLGRRPVWLGYNMQR